MAADARDALGVRKIQPAYRQVAEQLRDLILVGELGPGARLPNETEMSNMFAVSRSTVREALRVLSSQNLVVTRRGVGGGTFIAHPDPEHISDFLETSLGLLSRAEEVTVGELIELRGFLEAPAAELAATRRTDEDLEVLRETLEQERNRAEGDTFEQHRAFHQTILEASGNALLEIVTRPIFTTLRTRFLRGEAPPTFWKQVTDEHTAIFECIEAGDGAGARAQMQAHLAALAETYVRIDRRGKDGAEA
jgi:GntR family transcriptional regulator, transcriptional repressor for pyruvate dehydrogenase complex